MKKKYDFSGFVTRYNVPCSDGRTIEQDAFKHYDGKTIPLIWNHQHSDPNSLLGHADLSHTEEGLYAHCAFNNTSTANTAKEAVRHGDVVALSIYANRLKQRGGNVIHGEVREASLVLAGANPGAYIDNILQHNGDRLDDECIIYSGTNLELIHADSPKIEEEKPKESSDKSADDETVADVINTMNTKQKEVLYALVGMALDDDNDDDNEGDDDEMKQNIFEQRTDDTKTTLSHADGVAIVQMAKDNKMSIQNALTAYVGKEENALKHGFADADIEHLFPDYRDLKPGAPEIVNYENSWVAAVMSKAHKTPYSRLRTKQVDIRNMNDKAKGFKKGNEKTLAGNASLVKRTTDPTTIYTKDSIHRDDIVDITDFDVVAYQYQIMRLNLNEEVAMAITVSDGRIEGDDKIDETKVRPIWTDDELYTIHKDVDLAAMKTQLQGTDTGAYFGDNFVFAEAVIETALYAREEYLGSGKPDFLCTPHTVNKMLLARDRNGQRMYKDINDITKALNVGTIYTVEQYAGLTRTTADNKTKELLGLMVNFGDYNIGSTKGGEISKFKQFDIDFNQEKFLMETRISGALTKIKSAIALELDVTTAQG